MMRIAFFALICLLLSSISFGLPQTLRFDTSVTNIPTAFAWAGGSLVISEYTKPTLILIDNRTSSEVEVNCSKRGFGNVPAASEGNSYWVNANTSLIIDNPKIKGNCFVRSNSGAAISSGNFVIMVDGDN